MTSFRTDVAIIGGGFAGAAAATMLGRAGISTALVEPHAEKRPEFRCEKLSGSQVALLNLTGLAQDILPRTSINQEIWVIRYGRLIDRRPTAAAGFYYHDFVNSLNRIIPDSVHHFQTKARAIHHDGASPVIELATGDEIVSRVTILATGVNPGLRASAGVNEQILSKEHSISLGFDLHPVGRPNFEFPALTYYPDTPSQNIAYLTLFPVPGAMRANLFVYWASDDARLQEFRHNGTEALRKLMPSLEQFTGEYTINGHVSIRPVDLYRSTLPTVPGVVLAGDAYSTSCPAAGTGSDKVLTDVRLLCSTYIPKWLSLSTVSSADTDAFYFDPAKVKCEADSFAKAIKLRHLSTEQSLAWACKRGLRFAAQSVIGKSRGWLPSATPNIEVPARS